MTTNYKPRLNDYVKWKNLEGWIYYVDKEYVTIETSVTPKPKEDLDKGTPHKNNRCLVICFPKQYCELEYVTHRESVHSKPISLEDMYKSQTYRDRDLYQ